MSTQNGWRVEIVNSAQATIEHLRVIFSKFGLMVTDIGTCFTSSEFQEFAQRNSIRHTRIAPYHPSSNGLAERAVQTFKLGIRKQLSFAKIIILICRFTNQLQATKFQMPYHPASLDFIRM